MCDNRGRIFELGDSTYVTFSLWGGMQSTTAADQMFATQGGR